MHYNTYVQIAEKAANSEIQHPLPRALLARDASVGIEASRERYANPLAEQYPPCYTAISGKFSHPFVSV